MTARLHNYRPEGSSLPFADKDTLAADRTTFSVDSVTERETDFKTGPQQQYVFTITLRDGTDAGKSQSLTLAVNPVRAKLADAVKQHGACGPYRLQWIEGAKSKFWAFEYVEGADDSVHEREEAESDDEADDSLAALEGPEGDDDDDLPF